MATYQAQLDEIKTAITDLLSGKLQSYTIGGRTVNKLTLDPLLRERARLEPLAAREGLGLGGIRQRGGYVAR